jgi:TolB protein
MSRWWALVMKVVRAAEAPVPRWKECSMMTSRRLTTSGGALLLAAAALVLVFASAGSDAHAARLGVGTPRVGACDPTNASCVSTIAFTSTRDDPTAIAQLAAAEIYLMNPDGTSPRRLTSNAYADAFPTLSPDGKKIVFDSNRCLFALEGCPAAPQFDTAGKPIATEPLNTSELFVMNTDGSEPVRLARGSSATWSPNSKEVAFQASASYYASGGIVTGLPIRTDPGSATSDSDIFVANADDLLAGGEQPTNITNSPDMIDDDADWSPDGQKLVFTSHPVTDATRDSKHAELYVINPDGSGRKRLTFNDYEERAPAWSPDSSRIVYSCRVGPVNPLGIQSFRICVINADGTMQQLTDEGDSISDLTATWSPQGDKILFHRRVDTVQPDGSISSTQQLFLMNADGTDRQQLTSPPGTNNLAHWGEVRLTGANTDP